MRRWLSNARKGKERHTGAENSNGSYMSRSDFDCRQTFSSSHTVDSVHRHPVETGDWILDTGWPQDRSEWWKMQRANVPLGTLPIRDSSRCMQNKAIIIVVLIIIRVQSLGPKLGISRGRTLNFKSLIRIRNSECETEALNRTRARFSLAPSAWGILA